MPDSQCHTAATMSATQFLPLIDCGGPLLGLGCSRSAAALVSRKWEQVVGAACSVVSGGVVTEVEVNFAWLANSPLGAELQALQSRPKNLQSKALIHELISLSILPNWINCPLCDQTKDKQTYPVFISL